MSHPFRWLVGAAALAIAPKCALCIFAYVGVGAATFGRPDICGESESDVLRSMLPWLGMTAGGLCLLRLGIICRRERKARRR
jgi:hypothetical protein